MDDKTLADKIVALGVGCTRFEHSLDPTRYKVPNSHDHLGSGAFVRDPRVAMALIGLCVKHGQWTIRITAEFARVYTYGYQYFNAPKSYSAKIENSNERAICEACCDALEKENE